MPTNVHLTNYTRDGIPNIGDHDTQPAEVIESQGVGEAKSQYLTLGQYGVVAVTEFPDGDAPAQISTKVSQASTPERRHLDQSRRKKPRR